MILKIIATASKLNIKVVANGDVHYATPDMAIAKEILHAKDFKAEKVKVNEFGDEIFVDKEKFRTWVAANKNKNTNQYLKTTAEMLQEFDFTDVAHEIVVENTNLIHSMVDDIQIIPDELFTPEIPGVEEKLVKMVYEKARSIYGNDLPEIVEKRIEKEVNSITKYGFSVIYYISHKLVKHSLDAGYLVGSRGSVGSSLVATFMDITEINPLAPHYVCPSCYHSEFILDGSIGSGYDLELKDCPHCNTNLTRDGQDIPFETFLGFEGDKVPDIDLNFSGEFQSNAHHFVRSKDELNDDELFDIDHAFRAGTIGTIAEKTAYGYVRGYFELINDHKTIYKSDISYYLRFITGIKRTTGQHPGGIIVVPNHRSIYEFTPIQYPADDRKSLWRTTHFDFHSIHDNLLKLDILGHDDPTMLKKLHDLTGIDPRGVNITDPKVMELFYSTQSLGVTKEQILSNLGTQGVPEFGTPFVMGMLEDTKPSTFAELVQISGLSHGTDVWLGNAKDLIDQGTCELKEVIGCRDDIMVYLMHKGVDELKAFNIMENVRKGKGLKEDEIKILKENGVADWYIESCLKIKYMFPKAHAAAYVLMALRIAYFKVYHPLYYYAAYFSSRVDDFEVQFMLRGADSIMERIKLIEEVPDEFSEAKRKSKLNSLRMSLEMIQRGFKFLPFDLEKSLAFEFVIDNDETGLYLPFYSLDGLGEKEAIKIVEERDNGPFLTKAEFKVRTKVKKKSFEQLEYFEVFKDMAEENQMSLF
jgi:DNA polymerase-3 subunit alpha (Gram-positive type)